MSGGKGELRGVRTLIYFDASLAHIGLPDVSGRLVC